MNKKISNPNEIINDIIDEKIAQDPNRKREIGHYNCSEIGSCMRQWYFRYTNPKPIDNKTLRIFQMGHILHSWVDTLFANSKQVELKANEKSLLLIDSESGAVLHGRLDNQIVIGGEEMVVDTKTTAKIGNYPISIEYKMQLMPYLKAFNLKTGGILYVEKNTLTTKFVTIKYDEELFEEVFNRMRNIHKALVTSKIPEPEAKMDVKSKWKCRYCEYKEECDKIDKKIRGD